MKNESILKPILIIDDEPAILKFLVLCLTRRGYFVDTAGTGEEAIKKIESHNYSLIITDIKMPDLSGDQIYNFLRYSLKKSTPVVGMSGTPWLLDQSDFNAVLPKPCSIKEMLMVINQLI